MKQDEAPSTQIRAATTDDLAHVLRMRTERRSTWTQDEFLARIKDRCLWLAEREGELCAVLGLWPSRTRKKVSSAEVAVLYETRPFDGEVMEALLSVASEHARVLRAEIDAQHPDDHRLFESLGFKVKKAPWARKTTPAQAAGWGIVDAPDGGIVLERSI